MGQTGKRSWLPRWGLRSFLVFIALLCLLLGFWVTQVRPFRQQAAAANMCERLQCEWTYEEVKVPIWSEPFVPSEGRFSIRTIDLRRNFWKINPEVSGWKARSVPVRITSFSGNSFQRPSKQELILAISVLIDLRSLSLAYCGITDSELKSLGLLPNLEVLCLTGCPITDVSIDDLAERKNLRELYLRWTSLTPTGVEQLRQKLPDCEIYYRPRPAETPAVVNPNS